MNDFERDNDWQRKMGDRFLASFYGEYSKVGRYVFIEKSRCSALLQKRLAVDTIVQSPNGSSVCIEEKIVRQKWPCFFLETDSCTVHGYESEGWMKYGMADYLFYCFYCGDHLESYLIDFIKLRNWFWPVHENYNAHVMPNTRNHTKGRLVPIVDVTSNVPTKSFNIYEPIQAAA